MGKDAEQKHVVVVGAGPQGLATGIELLEKGFKVTILEAYDQLAQGVSYRPEHNTYGTAHSGVYYHTDTQRYAHSKQMFDLIAADPASDSTVMKIYRQNFRQNGKLIIASNDVGVENIGRFEDALKSTGSKVDAIRLTTAEEIAELRKLEPTLPENLREVLFLRNAGIINIKQYIHDLSAKFQELGGDLRMGHKVTGFEPVQPPKDDRKRGWKTGVQFETASGTGMVEADQVVNMAGMYVADVAEMAVRALKKAGSNGRIPPTPEVRYDRLYSLVEKPHVRERYVDRLLARYVTYNADLAAMDGPNSTVDIHTYCCDEMPEGSGKYSMMFGNYTVRGVSAEDIEDKNPTPPPMTEAMWEKAEKCCPKLRERRDDFELKLLGRLALPIINNGRDFFDTTAADSKLGISVLNCYTTDSPGLTCGPTLAQEIAGKVQRALELNLGSAVEM